MAKREYIDYKKLNSELFKRTEGYAANVGAVYRSALTEIINLVKGTELEAGKPFSFSEYGYSDEVTPILRSMYSRVYQIIRTGVEKEWLNANEHNDGLVKAIFGEHSIEDNHFARFFQRNMDAMKAFFARKTGTGLNLSQKVWKYTGVFKDELEDALDLAIGEGTPANRLATQIQKYLNDPDRFYRRFRVKIGENEDGTPKYGRVWKRRVYDAESGSYKWVDDDPRKYHPGRGVYRSSYRNAQRLARTETNIAYRTADYERWQKMPFVIGIEIKLSNNHPEPDICDDLKGIYPKTFKWSGWHPNCRCYQEPVLASPAELDKMLDNILDGSDPAGVACAGEVTAMPAAFRAWAKDNAERIDKATTAGTLPYFIRDNQELVEKGRVIKTSLSEQVKKRRKEIQRLAYATICSQILSAPGLDKPITISKKSVKEWLNQPFADVEAKNEALLTLPVLLENSQYCGWGIDKHMVTAKAHLFHVNIANHECWIVIREYHDGGCAVHSVSDNASILNIIKSSTNR